MKFKNFLENLYFLRRITHLSLYLFAMIAMLARIESSRRAGYSIDEDLKLLEIFSEQAKQVRKNSFRLMPTREDRLNDDMMSFIIPYE